MKTLDILTEDSVLLEKQIWGRRGAKLVRKYRCTSGRRKNRIVATPAQCFAAPNIKARVRMKQLRRRLGAKMMRKAQRTKRVNPASRVLRRLNR
jgi:hypothetical protein